MVKFTGFVEGVEAFRCLQRAAHIGKVVLEVPSRMNLDPTGTYVLSGAMGALGLTTAKALVEEGAKNVLLLSRSGKPAPDAGDAWAWLEASSAKIASKICDIGDAAAVKKVLKGVAEIKGAFHLAAVLDDAMLAELTEAHFERAFGAKVEGAKNLKAALPLDVDFLILYSSTAAVFGAAGQANYAAANASDLLLRRTCCE